MLKKASFKIIFDLIKSDIQDFDRAEVTKRLNIKPTENDEPKLSKGKVNCDNIKEANKEFVGFTILDGDAPPYKMIKHAFWTLELPKVYSLSVQEPINNLINLLSGKEKELVEICKEFALFARVIICINSNPDALPVLELPAYIISFFALINADVDFNLQLV